jgi:aminoglycoside phosphotransferase (APT) family kinase protein
MRTRSRLTHPSALVPAILEREAGSLSDRDGGLVVASEEVTSTGMAVVVMADSGGRPSLVIKLPMTAEAAEGLTRESRVLAALHANERLGDWRELVPRPLAQGSAGRRPYRVDTALGGAAPAESRPAEGGFTRWQEAAAETIHFLHRTTATITAGDAGLAERWVDAPLHELWPEDPRSRWVRTQAERLRKELHGAVNGQTFRASWVHGDFWLGNLLSEHAPSISGIVDWDAAAPAELAVHDVLHLLLATRRMAGGQELGRMVRDRLREAPWSGHERHLLRRYAFWCHDGALSDRHAVLLYWLRQVASHARQQSSRSAPRYRLWEIRNVYRVLTEL